MAAKLQNFPDISCDLMKINDLKRTSCASTGRRLSIWIALTGLRGIATTLVRTRCMPLATTASVWKVYSLRQNSSDWTPCEHVSQMASRVRQGRSFIFQSRPPCLTSQEVPSRRSGLLQLSRRIPRRAFWSGILR